MRTLKDTGPVADFLRLNTGIPPTPAGKQKRLGFIAGDYCRYPNGRRPVDDVFDISARAVAGILVDSTKYGTPLGDGVQTKTEGFNNSFPYRDARQQRTQQRAYRAWTGRLHRTTGRHLPGEVDQPLRPPRSGRRPRVSPPTMRQVMKRTISTLYW